MKNLDKKMMLIGFRIFFALLGFSAIVTEIATLIERENFVPSHFFCYFTVQSNLFTVIILLLSAFALAVDKQDERLAMLRGLSTLNIIIVGIVFSTLLAGLGQMTAVPWDNTVLHYIMPIFVSLDWLIDRPKKHISFKRALSWALVLVVYATGTMIRGYLTHWYPYPFLNPANQGMIGVSLTMAGIGIGTMAFIWLLTKLTGPT